MTAFSDDFNRADEANIGAPWQNHSNSTGNFGISSNRAVKDTSDGDAMMWYDLAATGSEQFSQWEIGTKPSNNDWGAAANVKDQGLGLTGYVCSVFGSEPGTKETFKFVNGTFTSLGTSPGTHSTSVGSTVKIETLQNGGTWEVRFFINGVQIDVHGDGSPISGGQPGVFWFAASGALDNWQGGDRGSTPGGSITGPDVRRALHEMLRAGGRRRALALELMLGRRTFDDAGAATAVSATFDLPYEALLDLRGILSAPYESLLELDVVLADAPWEANLSVSTQQPLVYEANLDVRGLHAMPYEGLLDLRGILVSPWEALLAVSAQQTVPWEAQLGVALTSTFQFPWEAQLSLQGTYATVYEALASIAAPSSFPYEAQGGVSATFAAVWEALASVSGTGSMPWEADGATVVSQAFGMPYEALLELRGILTASWEAQLAIAAAFVEPWEAQLGLAATFAAPYEALLSIAFTGQMPYEADGGSIPVAGTFAIPYEALATLQALSSIPYESIATIRALASSPYEALLTIAAVAGVPFEAVLAAIATYPMPWEASGFVATHDPTLDWPWWHTLGV